MKYEAQCRSNNSSYRRWNEVGVRWRQNETNERAGRRHGERKRREVGGQSGGEEERGLMWFQRLRHS